MNNNPCIMLVLFHIFRHYKRIDITKNRKDFLCDMRKCDLVLDKIKSNSNPEHSIVTVNSLVERINSFGNTIVLHPPLRYTDIYDSELIEIMSKITKELISIAKRPFFKKYYGEIFKRLLILHNLPRALINNTAEDPSIPNFFHISKQEALSYAAEYLDNYK